MLGRNPLTPIGGASASRKRLGGAVVAGRVDPQFGPLGDDGLPGLVVVGQGIAKNALDLKQVLEVLLQGWRPWVLADGFLAVEGVGGLALGVLGALAEYDVGYLPECEPLDV